MVKTYRLWISVFTADGGLHSLWAMRIAFLRRHGQHLSFCTFSATSQSVIHPLCHLTTMFEEKSDIFSWNMGADDLKTVVNSRPILLSKRWPDLPAMWHWCWKESEMVIEGPAVFYCSARSIMVSVDDRSNWAGRSFFFTVGRFLFERVELIPPLCKSQSFCFTASGCDTPIINFLITGRNLWLSNRNKRQGKAKNMTMKYSTENRRFKEPWVSSTSNGPLRNETVENCKHAVSYFVSHQRLKNRFVRSAIKGFRGIGPNGLILHSVVVRLGQTIHHAEHGCHPPGVEPCNQVEIGLFSRGWSNMTQFKEHSNVSLKILVGPFGLRLPSLWWSPALNIRPASKEHGIRLTQRTTGWAPHRAYDASKGSFRIQDWLFQSISSWINLVDLSVPPVSFLKFVFKSFSRLRLVDKRWGAFSAEGYAPGT